MAYEQIRKVGETLEPLLKFSNQEYAKNNQRNQSNNSN
jgi:hypothetical protein